METALGLRSCLTPLRLMVWYRTVEWHVLPSPQPTDVPGRRLNAVPKQSQNHAQSCRAIFRWAGSKPQLFPTLVALKPQAFRATLSLSPAISRRACLILGLAILLYLDPPYCKPGRH